jgi:hypothetical protein
MDFHEWKSQLFEDAATRKMLQTVLHTSDYVLELFWQQGTRPTVHAILHDATCAAPAIV